MIDDTFSELSEGREVSLSPEYICLGLEMSDFLIMDDPFVKN